MSNRISPGHAPATADASSGTLTRTGQQNHPGGAASRCVGDHPAATAMPRSGLTLTRRTGPRQSCSEGTAPSAWNAPGKIVTISTSALLCVVSLTLRYVTRFLDQRRERSLAKHVFDQTGSTAGLDGYAKLRQIERTVVIIHRFPLERYRTPHLPGSPCSKTAPQAAQCPPRMPKRSRRISGCNGGAPYSRSLPCQSVAPVLPVGVTEPLTC